ncbi:Maf family nucleotide pyrophosphatase [Flavobacterium sp.]|uniref:Maf family nucleotide pyrophosphatase n=1 Tax=Flavobacterium sp. TaxID=239 RepID=UPI002632EA18|nr:Maf family nucleotide pyrophosphatase [Flavobacterium sp.]MDD3004815.1 Maf family nucleotide pyrophosphatase [Flavobacterium sp.]
MFNKKLQDYQIVLASGSPRRQQFFKDLGFHFEIRLKEIDEIYPQDLQAHQITNFLSELKANAFKDELKENEILVTSDTIVWYENTALGKPKDKDEAFAILQKLSNSTHEVITSISFTTKDKITTLHDYTEVTFTELTHEMIEYYLTHFHPYDKAGSYGIQDWIGLVGVKSINGSYNNVMGLPTHLVFDFFNKF